MKIIHGALGVGGNGEDRPPVVLQDFEPAFDICNVIVANLGGDLKIGTEESRAKFGDQFFLRIAFPADGGALKRRIRLRPGGRPSPARTSYTFYSKDIFATNLPHAPKAQFRQWRILAGYSRPILCGKNGQKSPFLSVISS